MNGNVPPVSVTMNGKPLMPGSPQNNANGPQAMQPGENKPSMAPPGTPNQMNNQQKPIVNTNPVVQKPLQPLNNAMQPGTVNKNTGVGGDYKQFGNQVGGSQPGVNGPSGVDNFMNY